MSGEGIEPTRDLSRGIYSPARLLNGLPAHISGSRGIRTLNLLRAKQSLSPIGAIPPEPRRAIYTNGTSKVEF